MAVDPNATAASAASQAAQSQADAAAVAANAASTNSFGTLYGQSTGTSTVGTAPPMNAPAPPADPSWANEQIIIGTSAGTAGGTEAKGHYESITRLSDLVNLTNALAEVAAGKTPDVSFSAQLWNDLSSSLPPSIRKYFQELTSAAQYNQSAGQGASAPADRPSAKDLSAAEAVVLGRANQHLSELGLPSAASLTDLQRVASSNQYGEMLLQAEAVTHGMAKPTQVPGIPGGTQTANAGAYYQAFVNQLGNAAFRSGAVQKLLNAGLLNTDNPTDAQLANAYGQAIQQAVHGQTTVDSVLSQLSAQTGQLGAGLNVPSTAGADVAGLANQLGVKLTDQQTNELSATASANGWSTSQVREAVASMFTYDPTQVYSGLAGEVINEIKNTAGNYMVPISDRAIGDYVTNAIRSVNYESMFGGTAGAESAFTQQVQAQAKSLYPTLAPVIDQGITVRTAVDPYLQVASQLLGVAPQAVNAEDPKWQAFLQGGRDPKTGAPTLMGLDEWKKYMMQNPTYGFDKTQAAHDMWSSAAGALLDFFGKTSGSSSFGYSSSTAGAY